MAFCASSVFINSPNDTALCTMNFGIFLISKEFELQITINGGNVDK